MSIQNLPTLDHDEAELWLSKHYPEIISYMKPILDKRYPSLKDKKIKRTKLLLERTFSGKIIDALILIEIENDKDKPTSTGIRCDIVLVVDIKPKLERISEMQGQINRYADVIVAVKESNGCSIYRRPVKIILTLHNLDKYDKMLYEQDIYIIYVAHNIIYEDLQIPKLSYRRRDRYLTSSL
jgi:hypothetical protein